MSGSVEDLIIVQTVDEVQTGQVFERIPPHMTVLSWFTLDRLHIPELSERMNDLASQYGKSARIALGTERADYGINNDIPVCRMSVETDSIHTALREFADKHDATYHYVQFATNWSPHITDEPGFSVQPGQEVDFSSLALFSRQDDENGKRKAVEYAVSLADE